MSFYESRFYKSAQKFQHQEEVRREMHPKIVALQEENKSLRKLVAELQEALDCAHQLCQCGEWGCKNCNKWYDLSRRKV